MSQISLISLILLSVVVSCVVSVPTETPETVAAEEKGAHLHLDENTKNESNDEEKGSGSDADIEVVNDDSKIVIQEKKSDKKSKKANEEEAKVDVKVLYRPKDCPRESKRGDFVAVHYTGELQDGEVFDTTLLPQKQYVPFQFILGTGHVIKGFERGINGMCIGEKRNVTIPPALGYGKKGAGNHIPPNATIRYKVEMVDVRDPPPHVDVFTNMDKDGDKKLSRKEVSDYYKSQAEAQNMPVDDEDWQEHHEKMVENIFDHEDQDEDGEISHDEFSGPKLKLHEEL